MVGATHCSVPGCNYSKRKRSSTGTGSEKRALFAIHRPDLAKTNEEEKHRLTLTKFILSLRDFSKGDCIKDMLKKETAAICEKHFKEEDILTIGQSLRKRLKCGAVPCKNLPKSNVIYESKTRKPPCKRDLDQPIRHGKLSDVVSSYNKLSSATRDKWIMSNSQNSITFLWFETDELIPKIKVTVDDDLALDGLEIYGWPVDFSSLDISHLLVTTLHSFLSDIENIRICRGVDECSDVTKLCQHPVLKSNNRKVILVNTYHSTHCTLFCMGDEMNKCASCAQYAAMEQECVSTASRSAYSPSGCDFDTGMTSGNESATVNDDGLLISEEDPSTFVTIFAKDKEKLNSWQRMFFNEQIKYADTTNNGRRYHPDVVRWSIELYHRSPAAYLHLTTSGVLALPNRATIASYRNNISSTPGLSVQALDEISRVSASADLAKQLHCFLALDEMKIKENLVMKDGKLVGFVYFGDELPQMPQIASCVLVFYLRSFDGRISIPVAWYPTASTPAYILSLLFWEILGECECRGASILAIVCDGHPSNRKFFKLISGDLPSGNGHVASNPYAPERPVLLISDPSHLLKTTRNALYSSKPGGTKYLCKGGKDILWGDIVELVKLEQKSLLVQQCRLSLDHVSLNSYTKMKVNLAKDILSWAVGKCLRMLPNAQGTAEFVELFAKWFDIVNCGWRNPIRSSDDERLHWLENEFLRYLQEWEEEVKQRTNETKRIMAQTTLDGLMFTTKNLIRLTNYLLQHGHLKVCLRTCSQDVLEAFFGNIRSHGRRCSNPDVHQTSYAIQHTVSRKIIKKIKGGNTTYGRKNPWTSVCDEPMPKRKSS